MSLGQKICKGVIIAGLAGCAAGLTGIVAGAVHSGEHDDTISEKARYVVNVDYNPSLMESQDVKRLYESYIAQPEVRNASSHLKEEGRTTARYFTVLMLSVMTMGVVGGFIEDQKKKEENKQ